jgi:hypothetical protein
MARSTLSYELRLPAKDAPVLAAMKELSALVPALRLPAHSRVSAPQRASS